MRLSPRLALPLAAAFAAAALPAAAAGIDCAKAANRNEQAICTDPLLRARDGELAAAYAAALKASDYRGELKQDQQAWLRERDRCDGQVRCLRMAYVGRLTELKPAAVSGKFDWAGEWTRSDGTATLSLKPLDGDRYELELQSSAGANTGLLSGRARKAGASELSFKGQGDNAACALTFHRFHRQIQIEQQHTGSDCGAGMGVYFSGRYLPGLPAAVATTHWTLLDLGVVLKAEDDARLRKLLGDDYDALVERMDVTDTRTDDELKAEVTNGYVRGLAVNMRALLIQAGDGRQWAAIRGEDKQGHAELRYYSSDPAWTGKLPAALDAWSDGYQEQVPVRLMSAGGRVLGRP